MGLYSHQPLSILVLVSVPGFALGSYAYRLLTKKNLNGFFQILVPSFLVIFLTFDMVIAPISNQKESFEPLFQYAGKLRAEGAELGLLKPEERLDGAAVFYLGECIPRFNSFEAVNEFVNSGKKTMVITRAENIENNPDICIINSFDIDNKTIVIFTSKAFAKDKS